MLAFDVGVVGNDAAARLHLVAPQFGYVVPVRQIVGRDERIRLFVRGVQDASVVRQPTIVRKLVGRLEGFDHRGIGLQHAIHHHDAVPQGRCIERIVAHVAVVDVVAVVVSHHGRIPRIGSNVQDDRSARTDVAAEEVQESFFVRKQGVGPLDRIKTAGRLGHGDAHLFVARSTVEAVQIYDQQSFVRNRAAGGHKIVHHVRIVPFDPNLAPGAVHPGDPQFVDGLAGCGDVCNQ